MVKSFSPLIGKGGVKKDLYNTFKVLARENKISEEDFDLILI